MHKLVDSHDVQSEQQELRPSSHLHSGSASLQRPGAGTSKNGRAPAVGLCQTAQSAPGHPPLQGPAHASMGISLLGACEGLCRWRGTIEPLAANGTLEPLVAADLDLVNMFGNAEWSCIRAALRIHFPEAAAWTEWRNTKPIPSPTSPRELPSPPTEQGDVLGTIQSALVLGQARAAHLGEFLSNPAEHNGIFDEWFVDDGQVFVRPFQFDPFLRVLDGALATFGATRGCVAHGNVKSSARLLCPPQPQKHHGAGVSLRLSRAHQCTPWGSVRAGDEMRSAIGSVDHAPTEMVLTRQCADVSKLTYHKCINGDMLEGNCGPPPALRSLGTCRTTPGGKPPRASPAADWASTRRWVSRSPPSSPVASWPPPGVHHGSTTSATLWGSRTSSSWQNTTRAPMLPSHASSRRSRPTRLSFFFDSWTTPWLSVNVPGATSSLESRTPCRISPPLPSARSRHHPG